MKYLVTGYEATEGDIGPWLAVDPSLRDVYLRLEQGRFDVLIKLWSGAVLARPLIMACVLPLSCSVDSL